MKYPKPIALNLAIWKLASVYDIGNFREMAFQSKPFYIIKTESHQFNYNYLIEHCNAILVFSITISEITLMPKIFLFLGKNRGSVKK
jgi:hypothetical protein